MLYEMIAVSITAYIFSKHDYCKYSKKDSEIDQRSIIVDSNNFVVSVFVIFALLVYVFIPTSKTGLSFLMLKANTGLRVSLLEVSTIDVLFRQVVLIGAYSAFVIGAVVFVRKYDNTQNKMYMIITLLLALLASMIIVSEARSSQIYSGYACFVLLSVLYPEYKKSIQRTLLISVLCIVGILSVYKAFYAFNYSSYAAALSAASFSTKSITEDLEIYCLGPLHYTAIIELGFWNDTFPISRAIFGLLRTVMGTNLLVKNIDMNTTSMVFNEFVTGNRANTGYLLPITGLGYFYFSPVLAPIITCLVYRIASKLEYSIKNAKSAFSLFFMSYVYIRVSTALVFTNINTILTMASMIILSAGIIAILNRRITLNMKSIKRFR